MGKKEGYNLERVGRKLWAPSNLLLTQDGGLHGWLLYYDSLNCKFA